MTPKFALILCGFASCWAVEILAAFGVFAESRLVLGIVGIITLCENLLLFFSSSPK